MPSYQLTTYSLYAVNPKDLAKYIIAYPFGEVNTRKDIFMSKNNVKTFTEGELHFTEDNQLREKYINRTEVLNKVKELFLIPHMELMTMRQVAEYYEVDVETAQKQYKRNNDEFKLDGAKKYSISDVHSLIGTKCPNLKTTNYRGRMEIEFDENTKLIVPNVGIILFPKRAILRMGMLLRDSEIAKEVSLLFV